MRGFQAFRPVPTAESRLIWCRTRERLASLECALASALQAAAVEGLRAVLGIQGHFFWNRIPFKVNTALHLFILRGEQSLATRYRLKTKDTGRAFAASWREVDRVPGLWQHAVGFRVMTRRDTAAHPRPSWCKMVLGWILLAAFLSHLPSVAAQIQLNIRIAGTSVITVNGTEGTLGQAQWSDDLADPGGWFHLDYCALSNETCELSDPSGGQVPRRYYRVVQVPDTNTVLIPAGTFLMGNTFSNLPTEQELDETPVHRLHVSAFYMDRYEVTKALWDDVYVWATNHGYRFDHPGDGKAAAHPVHSVSWHDAVKWCNARSEKAGLSPCYYADTNVTVVYRTGNTSTPPVIWSANGYRLPTEAEWEKAARGGAVGQRFPWNDTNVISHSRANYYSLFSPAYPYDVSPTRSYHPLYKTGNPPYTAPVGSFAANAYGLHDMAGNVAEWCWDPYEPDWYSQPGATQPDAKGPATSPVIRVVRGGSWNDRANYPRCADRFSENQSNAGTPIGFRCVRRP